MKKPMTDEQKARKKQKDREYRERVKADPELAARRLAMSQASKAKRMANPDYAEKEREKSSARAKRNREKDPEKVRASVERYRRENREKVLAQQRERQRILRLDPDFRAKKSESDRRSRIKHADARRAQRKRNAAAIKLRTQRYRARPEVRARRNITRKLYWVEQMKNPVNKMLHIAKGKICKIRRLVRLGHVPKTGESRFIDYFGAEPDIVLQHISSLFSPEMNWENWGPIWHIDHIIPISFGAKNIELLAKLNHYRNLRPLLASANLSKSDKMPDFFPEGVPFTREEVGFPMPQAELKDPAALSVC